MKKKSITNQKKHGISFNEASSVFTSGAVRIFIDSEHSSHGEDRLIAIGYSYSQKLLVVVHCYFEDLEIIRIVSARRATKLERIKFEEK